MPKEFSRTLRVAEVLRRELARILQRGVKDPRLSMLTITEVDLSKDLSYAKIYVTSLEKEPDKKKILQGLESAKGFLRRELAGCVGLRAMPELRFFYDDTVEEGNRIAGILDKL